jgi:hypothetical protein
MSLSKNQVQALLTLGAMLAGDETANKEQGSMDILKALGASNQATLLGQPRGIFSTVGLENDVISTHVAPMGLGAEMPVFANRITDPRYGFLTGYTTETGTRPVNPCDDAPKGYVKSGTLTAQFGRVAHQTQTIEIDTLFEQARGSNTGLQLMGTVLGMNNISPNISQADMLNLVVRSEMVGVGVQFERDLSHLLWRGTPANNTAGGGHKEFPGLDYQVATGQVDADTNVAIKAADSYIEDFGLNRLDGTTRDIVEDLAMMEYFLFNLANRTGVGPVTWKIVMRPELWFELTSIYACRYLTNRCTTSGGSSPIVINDGLAVQMRDQMRQGMYLDINGRRYDVVEDDGIYESDSTNLAGVPKGSFASSIYFMPMKIRGSFPVLYWEHKDYRGLATEVAPMGQGAKNLMFWSDNGRFMWTMTQNRYCFDLQAKVEPRAVLRTPHLAGRLDRVLYTPKRHLRSSDPASSYFVNGGVSLRPGTTTYAVWK